MSLWIVTIGSSDIQLNSDKTSQEKGRTDKQRSDKVWNYWYDDELKAKYHDIQFEPKQLFKDKEETYRIAPRILGAVYQENSELIQQEIWNYLTFPLLDNFVKRLETAPEGIVVLLTDQSNIFSEYQQRRRVKSPYWQDTCELRPILKRYFESRFHGIPCEFISLIPELAEQSLDNWDSVLTLVQDQFRGLTIAGQKIEAESHSLVYVSHQAGTPAISSAVQFVSLAKFGDRVWFLVSNEYQPEQTDFVESSSYLRGIQVEQAKKLLNRYDYNDLLSLLKPHLDCRKPNHKRIRSLLRVAIQWNRAKLKNFKRLLIALKIVEDSDFPWYWMGYEGAYLAIIRYRQGNIIEALFHGFRSVEGSICRWAETKYRNYIYYDEKKSPQITESIELILPDYWKKIKERNSKWLDDLGRRNQNNQAKGKPTVPISVGLFSLNLYTLLEMVRPETKSDQCMKIVLYSAKDERNQQFHRLLGLQKSDLFKAWQSKSVEDWEAKLVGCHNFIAKEDLPIEFVSLESASLMHKVHQELEQAIEQL
jgi:hypothetical protein